MRCSISSGAGKRSTDAGRYAYGPLHAGDHRPDRRQHALEIQAIDFADESLRLAEIENADLATGRQHAINLAPGRDRSSPDCESQTPTSPAETDPMRKAGSARRLRSSESCARPTSAPRAPAWRARNPHRTARPPFMPPMQREGHVTGAAAQVEHLRIGTAQHIARTCARCGSTTRDRRSSTARDSAGRSAARSR